MSESFASPENIERGRAASRSGQDVSQIRALPKGPMGSMFKGFLSGFDEQENTTRVKTSQGPEATSSRRTRALGRADTASSQASPVKKLLGQ